MTVHPPNDLDPFAREVVYRLNRQDKIIDEQVLPALEEIRTNTNGRLRSIELWQARVDGAKAAYHWVPALLAGGLGTGIGALIGTLTGH